MKLVATSLFLALFLFAACTSSTYDEESLPNISNLTCQELCLEKYYNSSRCDGAAVVPDANPICYKNETNVGETSDCSIYADGEPIIGALKSCCCN